MIVVRRVKASDLKAPGHILDAARDGIVTIERRTEEFVLMKRAEFDKRLAEAADPTPKTLEDMLVGYDREAGRYALAAWMADAPVGSEIL